MISLKSRLISGSVKRHKPFLSLKRLKSSSKAKGSDPREKALEHFDDFYKALFRDRWPSIRLGLLSKQKYIAVLNNFGDVDKTEEFLQMQGAFDLGSFLETQKVECKQSKSKNSDKMEQKRELGEVIKEKQKLEEMREISELHPEAMEFMSKVEVLGEETEERKATQEVQFNPEESRSSLQSDLLTSQIDKSRMIEPEEGIPGLGEYVPATQLRGLDDYIPESEYYKYYQMSTHTPISVEKEFDLDFPVHLRAYTFDRGDITEFPSPVRSTQNVYNYLEVEGSDLLTALALGVEPEDSVLDLCSHSGSSAYCIFQTLRPRILVCVTSGTKDTTNIFSQHLHNFSNSWNEMLMITNCHLTEYMNDELFDKVLINVPSTQDKLSVLSLENNVFHPNNIRNRLRLPATQSALLLKAFSMVRPGGTVLYATSTLSPVQNDGVVSGALKSAWDTTRTEFVVKDLAPALEHASILFHFGDFLSMKYGTLVVPFAPSNFGPKYFCKLVKKENRNKSVC